MKYTVKVAYVCGSDIPEHHVYAGDKDIVTLTSEDDAVAVVKALRDAYDSGEIDGYDEGYDRGYYGC